MAVNDSAHPEFARTAQDVEGELASRRPSSSDSFHGGRGGVGNVVHSTDSDLVRLRHEEEERDRLAAEVAKPAPIDHAKIDYRGWADRGKDFLKEKMKGGK
ncbi:hypothetical protein B9Z19DRAFT_1100160 [Tuber borchii]|uniref:Uncharacterized protein n=1 Tax=Tuber borchii TaxID=42251 RepID=A0A2T6ZYW8_TUBBO|nr:hypothetical protein B9Z19DRAFT_1100160 [Tuber borchii]